MARIRDYLAELCQGWRVEQVRQIVNETLHELINPYVYAEAAALIERAPGGRPRHRAGLHLRRGDGPADRRAARHHRRDRHPDGRRRRPVHRRGRLLRRRPDQGRGGPRSLPRIATTTWPTATRTPTRSPTCRCWRRSATPPRSTRTGLRRVAPSGAGRCRVPAPDPAGPPAARTPRGPGGGRRSAVGVGVAIGLVSTAAPPRAGHRLNRRPAPLSWGFTFLPAMSWHHTIGRSAGVQRRLGVEKRCGNHLNPVHCDREPTRDQPRSGELLRCREDRRQQHKVHAWYPGTHAWRRLHGEAPSPCQQPPGQRQNRGTTSGPTCSRVTAAHPLLPPERQ